jgi:hypothetical protein
VTAADDTEQRHNQSKSRRKLTNRREREKKRARMVLEKKI